MRHCVYLNLIYCILQCSGWFGFLYLNITEQSVLAVSFVVQWEWQLAGVPMSFTTRLLSLLIIGTLYHISAILFFFYCLLKSIAHMNQIKFNYCLFICRLHQIKCISSHSFFNTSLVFDTCKAFYSSELVFTTRCRQTATLTTELWCILLYSLKWWTYTCMCQTRGLLQTGQVMWTAEII